MADPALMAEAYRRGLLPAARAQAYEEAVKRGLVTDPYVSGRLESGNGVMGSANAALSTFASAVPGLSEAGAGLGALADVAEGRAKSLGAAWEAERARQQGLQAGFQQQHPVIAPLTQGAALAAQVAPLMATGGAAAAPELSEGGSALARFTGGVARNATMGAGASALNAASQPGTVGQRAQAATSAMGPGAALGVVLPGVVGAGRLAAGVARGVGSGLSETVDALGRSLSEGGGNTTAPPIPMTPQVKARALDYISSLGATPDSLNAAADTARAAAKPVTTAEAIGPVGISRVAGMARRVGATPALADATLSARAADRGQRILSDIQQTTGVEPQAAQGDIDHIVLSGQRQADPLFDVVRANTDPIMSPELAKISQRPAIQSAMKGAVNDLLNAGKNPTMVGAKIDPDTGAPVLDEKMQPVIDPNQLTAEGWDTVRRHLNASVDRDAFGRVIPDAQSIGNRNINVASRDLTQVLAGDGGDNPGLVPGLRDALDVSGDYLSQQQAYTGAKGFLFSNVKTPYQFNKFFSGLSPAEQDAAKASMANDIFVGVQNGSLKPTWMSRPAVQAKLSTAFGDDATADLTSRMQTEADMAAAEARMRPNLNSVTGDVAQTAAEQDAVGGAALRGGLAVARGDIGGVVRQAGNIAMPLIRGAKTAVDQSTRDAVGQLLLSHPGDVAQMLSDHLSTKLPNDAFTSPLSAASAAQVGQDIGDQPQVPAGP